MGNTLININHKKSDILEQPSLLEDSITAKEKKRYT